MSPASDGERERGSWWQGQLPWPLTCALAQGATLRKAPVLGVMLCYHCLEILSKLNILENFYSLISGCAGCSVLCSAFSLRWLLLLGSSGSRARGLPSLHHLGSQLWLLGALWRVDPSSQTRGQAHVSGIGRRTLPLSRQGEAPLSEVFTKGPQVFILHGPRQFCSRLR